MPSTNISFRRRIQLATAAALLVALPSLGNAQRPTAAQDTTPVLTSSTLPTGRATYRTLVETNLELEQLAAKYPDRVIRVALPHKTVLGQTVYSLEISRNIANSGGKPVFLMTGLHHSREWPTVDLTMEFVHDILMNDGKDPRITALLDRVRFVVVPVVNPDGYEMSRSLLNEQKRKSCRVVDGQVPTFAECANPLNRNAGVDLNRNYGAFWGGSGASVGANGSSYRGPAPFSEPEIQNIRDLMNRHQVVVALSNHTPDAKVLRAPSAPEEPIPADVEAYDALAQAVGKDLNWEAGPWPEIYYAASGTMEEYGYYSAGTFAFTFENTPGQRGFHPAYNFVVDQYHGTGAYPASSARNGFLRLYEAAANSALHSVLDIRAPGGATLTLEKRFILETSRILQADTSRVDAIKIPTTIRSTMTVPAGSSRVSWHVNPSLRPSQHAQEHLNESWTLTCSLNGQSKSTQVRVARGATAAVDLATCR
ncbi:MAG: M14 family zinc carboxypeptidase [Gemmatimonadota bacterium]|nr:M14 family zinc carboxypeptidase [Gemmatimonadota bacterium]